MYIQHMHDVYLPSCLCKSKNVLLYYSVTEYHPEVFRQKSCDAWQALTHRLWYQDCSNLKHKQKQVGRAGRRNNTISLHRFMTPPYPGWRLVVCTPIAMINWTLISAKTQGPLKCNHLSSPSGLASEIARSMYARMDVRVLMEFTQRWGHIIKCLVFRETPAGAWWWWGGWTDGGGRWWVR